MKYLDEFRDVSLAKNLIHTINAEVKPQRQYRLMEFCGGHTHAIFRFGLHQLLPKNIELIHGPGCPVCVLPSRRIDQAIAYAQQADTMLCSFGDMLRVPGARNQNLLKTKAKGACIEIVYSANDALKLAEAHPHKKVIFFAIGFETTTPPTAFIIQQAQQRQLDNFLVFNNHVMTPPAIKAILDSNTVHIDGLIGPGHVSTITGTQVYDALVNTHQRPIVISGFEPLDILHSILLLVRQLNEKRIEVENAYQRAVNTEGNRKALSLIEDVFDTRAQFEWRGLGYLPHSALRIKEKYAAFDAETQRPVGHNTAPTENQACACPDVLRGIKKPYECEIFATTCTPETPIGACMVSSEGACAAQYRYDRKAG